MPRKIVLVNPADNDDYIQFDLLRIQDPYPEFEYIDPTEEHQMRITSTTPGNRVFTYAGVDENHWDINLTLHLVIPAEVEKIRTWYSARPPVMKYSNDGLHFYWVAFKRGGFRVAGYPNNEDPEDTAPYFNIVTLSLAVLESCSTPPDFVP